MSSRIAWALCDCDSQRACTFCFSMRGNNSPCHEVAVACNGHSKREIGRLYHHYEVYSETCSDLIRFIQGSRWERCVVIIEFCAEETLIANMLFVSDKLVITTFAHCHYRCGFSFASTDTSIAYFAWKVKLREVLPESKDKRTYGTVRSFTCDVQCLAFSFNILISASTSTPSSFSVSC